MPLQSEECLEKTVESMKVLARESPKYYLLTGASMKGKAQKLLGLRYIIYCCCKGPLHAIVRQTYTLDMDGCSDCWSDASLSISLYWCRPTVYRPQHKNKLGEASYIAHFVSLQIVSHHVRWLQDLHASPKVGDLPQTTTLHICLSTGNEFLLYTTSEAAANRLGGWDNLA